MLTISQSTGPKVTGIAHVWADVYLVGQPAAGNHLLCRAPPATATPPQLPVQSLGATVRGGGEGTVGEGLPLQRPLEESQKGLRTLR